MCPCCYQQGGSLLHCLSTLTPTREAVYFCCTGLGVTSTGRYPASCPVKPGLSSSDPAKPLPEKGSAFFGRNGFAFSAAIISSTYCKSHYIAFYTLKQLPPQNSRIKELFGMLSAGTLRKYPKNLSSLCAS